VGCEEGKTFDLNDGNLENKKKMLLVEKYR